MVRKPFPKVWPQWQTPSQVAVERALLWFAKHGGWLAALIFLLLFIAQCAKAWA